MKKFLLALIERFGIDGNTKWYVYSKFFILSLPYYLMRVFPVCSDKIVFVSFRGAYGGDPKYISDKIHEINPQIQCVWLLSETSQIEDEFIKKVKYGSLKAIYELVTAKVWVDDCRKYGYERKRKSQFYIGTGHGGIPMKKIEKDAEEKLPFQYILAAKKDSQMTNLKPSNSVWRNNMLRRAFWYNGEIINCGLPRVEYILKNRDRIRLKVKKELHISKEKGIYLYAPTFREANTEDIYSLEFEKVGSALKEKYGGEWIGLRRLHPNIRDYEAINIDNVVIDVTSYPDMENLLLASDILITDYSSCMFETMFLNIPGFIFAKDIEHYLKNERGLYWDLKMLPFPIATTNDELTNQIINFDENEFRLGLDNLRNEVGLFDNQLNATEILAKRILREMGYLEEDSIA